MRVEGGSDYIEFVQELLSNDPKPAGDFGKYDLRFFDDFPSMQTAIAEMDRVHGLSRLVSGFAWPWKSKDDPNSHDIEIQGKRLFWNKTATDWINSKTSSQEVGSIHTVQGYDLNYAGVIIGPDLRWDSAANKIAFNRSNYFDVKGRENNNQLDIEYSDEEILQFIINIYRVLMTRGIKGTFVYVYDKGLQSKLRMLHT
jgi:hypothetical protein